MVSSEDQASVKSEDSPASRVKFLCSYGGRILPRPQDGHLRYVGGETRMVAVNRHITYAELTAKLQSFFGPNLRFKYQLPNEDLDALISVTCDEDVDNMMDEYDKNDSREGSSRLRAFLFPPAPSSIACSFFQDVMDEPKSPDRKYVESVNTDARRVVRVPSHPSHDGTFQVPDFLFGLDPANRQQNYHRHQHHDSEVTSSTYLYSHVVEPPSRSQYQKDTVPVTSFAPPVLISQAEYLIQPAIGPEVAHSTSPALAPLILDSGRHAWDAEKGWDGGSGGEQREESREERWSGDIPSEVVYIASPHRESAIEPGLRRISSKDRLLVHPVDGSPSENYVLMERHPPKIQKQQVHTSTLLNEERQRPDEIHIDAPGLPELRHEFVASNGRMQRTVDAHKVSQQGIFGVQDGTEELPPGSSRNSGDSDVRIEGQAVGSILNKAPTITDVQAEGENMILQQLKQPDFEVSFPHPSHQMEVPQHMNLGKGHFQQVHWQARETVDQRQQQAFDTVCGNNAAAVSRIIPSHSSHLPVSGAVMHHYHLPSTVTSTGRVVTRVDALPNARVPSPLYRQVGNQVLVCTEPQQLTRAISPLRDNSSANGPTPQRYAVRMVQVHEPRVIHSTAVQQPSGFPVSPVFVDFSEPHTIYEHTHYLENVTKGNIDMGIGQVQYSNKIVAPDHDQSLVQANYTEDNLKVNPQYVQGINFQDNYAEDKR